MRAKLLHMVISSCHALTISLCTTSSQHDNTGTLRRPRCLSHPLLARHRVTNWHPFHSATTAATTACRLAGILASNPRLATAGICWQLLATGNCWQLRQPATNCWQLLATIRNCWQPLATAGDCCVPKCQSIESKSESIGTKASPLAPGSVHDQTMTSCTLQGRHDDASKTNSPE